MNKSKLSLVQPTKLAPADKTEDEQAELVIIYYPDFPSSIDAVYYFNLEKWDCLQFSTRLKNCPLARTFIKAYFLEKVKELNLNKKNLLDDVMMPMSCDALGIIPMEEVPEPDYGYRNKPLEKPARPTKPARPALKIIWRKEQTGSEAGEL